MSSRQPAASSQLLRDDRTGPPRHAGGFGGAALQADGRPPSSSRPRPLVPAGRVRRRERGARRERCGSLQRCGARSGVELATGEPRPRRALRRAAGRQGGAARERPEGGQVAMEPRARLRGQVGRHRREHQRSTEQREQRRSSSGRSGATGDAPSSHPPWGATYGWSAANAPRMRTAFGNRFSPRGAPHRRAPRGEAFQRRPPNRRGAFDRHRTSHQGQSSVQ